MNEETIKLIKDRIEINKATMKHLDDMLTMKSPAFNREECLIYKERLRWQNIQLENKLKELS